MLVWIRTGVLLGLVALVAGCGSNHGKNDGKYKPVVNPQPRYFMTVEGRVDPILTKKFKLKLGMRYYSTNPKCRVLSQYSSPLEGAKFDRDLSDFYVVKPNDAGQYHIKIPLDKYKSGYCRWQPLWLGYTLTDSKLAENDIAYFLGKKKTNSKHHASQTLSCVLGFGCKYVSDAFFKSSLYPRGNYQFSLNIISGVAQ